MTLLGTAVRQAWPYALISGGTGLVTFLALPSQSLPGKQLAGDWHVGPGYTVTAVLVATTGILAVLLLRSRRRWSHLVVPALLAAAVPAVVVACGGGRSRWGTGLLCLAAAAGVHVALELPRRRFRLLACGLLAAGSVLFATGCQAQWRAEEFRVTGLPFAVAEIPGYELTGTYADVGVIFLQYRDTGGRNLILDVTIARSCGAYWGADLPGSRCRQLPGGGFLAVGLPAPLGYSSRTGPLPDGITVRPVTATYLGSFPVSDVSLPD